MTITEAGRPHRGPVLERPAAAGRCRPQYNVFASMVDSIGGMDVAVAALTSNWGVRSSRCSMVALSSAEELHLTGVGH